MNLENPLKILLAEDDLDDRLFFDKALKGIPIATHLTTVRDGQQLMSYLLLNSKQLPDLLFLDLSMPKKTGYECLAEIKANKELKVIPVVIFTTSFGRSSYFEQNLINTLINLGALDYIRKPGNTNQLKQLIRIVLIRILKKNEPNAQEVAQTSFSAEKNKTK